MTEPIVFWLQFNGTRGIYMNTEKKDVKRTSTTPFIRIPEKAKLHIPKGKVAVHKVEKGQVFV